MHSLEQVLQQRLDTFVGGERSENQLLQDLAALCVTPNASWEALSLIDQYHRRGKLSAEIARSARRKIERKLFGLQDAGDDGEAAQHVPRARTADGAAANMAAARSRRATTTVAVAQLPPVRDLAPELAAARAELEVANRRLKETRRRLAVLSRFGHSRRSELRAVRRELGVVSMQAATYLEQLGSLQQRQLVTKQPAELTPTDSAPVSVARNHRLPQLQGAALLVLLLVVVLVPAYLHLRPRATPPPLAVVAPEPTPLPPAPVPGMLNWANDRYIVQPGDSMAELNVVRADGTDGEVSFEWWTEPAGAKSGFDYVGVRAKSGLLRDGASSLPIYVRLLPNPARRYTEMFYVMIGKPGGGATLGEPRRATVFLLPNEARSDPP